MRQGLPPRNRSVPAANEVLQRGISLHQSGQLAEAAKCYEAVLAQDSRSPAANHLLGLVKLAQNRPDEAVRLISRAVELNAGDPQYLGNLGVALNAAGRSAEAVATLDRAILLKPDFAEAWSNKGMALRALKRNEDAIEAYRQAARLKPMEAGFHFNLANALYEAGYVFDAEAAYRRAVDLRPNYAKAMLGLARSLDGEGRASEALSLMVKAIASSPNDPDLHLRRGRALYSLNRLPEAVASYDRAIELRPSYGEAYLHRAYMRRHQAGDPSVEPMQRLFDDESEEVADRIFAGFGLGKVLSDLGRHRESIDVFTRANGLSRARITYSADQAVAELRRDVERFEGVSAPLPDGGFREATPIFVVGLPRSGKTTVETILGRHPLVKGVGELPTMERLVRELERELDGKPISQVPPDRFTELGRAYMREAQKRVASGKILVDTMPSNYRHVGFIRLAMPNARIVRCIRPTADHCVAIYEKYLTNAGYEYSSDMDELQVYHRAHLQQMTEWHRLFPGAIYDMDLAALQKNRMGTIRKLLEFCGLEWNDACLAEAPSEPQLGDWPREQLIRRQHEHLAAWREVRPQLFEINV